MKMKTNSFLKAIKGGEKQIGLWLSLCNNYAADIVSTSGYDWFLLDMEHSPNEVQLVLGQLQAIAAGAGTAIVRPDWNDTVKVKRLMDIGAPGLLFPMIQTVDEAKAAVAATRYPPKGVRGVSGAQRGNAFGRASDYFSRVDDETAVLVQLETRSAMDIAEDIASVDGIDGVFFGPADIGADLGHVGQPMHPEVWEHVRPVAKKLMAKGVPVGTLVFDPKFAAELLSDGFSFVACGSDLALLSKGADALLADVKGRLV
jgi:4-hydroxy-2-oxoheptanedioate aldolase